MSSHGEPGTAGIATPQLNTTPVLQVGPLRPREGPRCGPLPRGQSLTLELSSSPDLVPLTALHSRLCKLRGNTAFLLERTRKQS